MVLSVCRSGHDKIYDCLARDRNVQGSPPVAGIVSWIVGLGLQECVTWFVSISIHSQVEHMLNDRLLQFVNMDLHEVKVHFPTLFITANLLVVRVYCL